MTISGLIGPPYSKSYPQMWEQIQRFIMWAEITVDDGLQAGEMFPEIHQFFMDERPLRVSRHPGMRTKIEALPELLTIAHDGFGARDHALKRSSDSGSPQLFIDFLTGREATCT